MAVVFAVVGAAVVGIATSDDHSDYDDYYDHSDYDDYSNYSDAAERRQRRINAKQSEVDKSRTDVNQYKINNVNSYLESENLINQSGVSVNMSSVKQDGDQSLITREKKEKQEIAAPNKAEIKAIEDAIAAIDAALKK